MIPIVVTPATSAPIVYSDVKKWARILDDDEQTIVESIAIPTAVNIVEKYVNRALMPQTLEIRGRRFNKLIAPTMYGEMPSFHFGENEIRLPRAPIVSVTWVKYTDVNGVLQTLATSAYEVSIANVNSPAFIRPVVGSNWPDVSDVVDAIQIRYQAGYASVAAIPANIIAALTLLAAHIYENRSAADVPSAIYNLLDEFVVN